MRCWHATAGQKSLAVAVARHQTTYDTCAMHWKPGQPASNQRQSKSQQPLAISRPHLTAPTARGPCARPDVGADGPDERDCHASLFSSMSRGFGGWPPCKVAFGDWHTQETMCDRSIPTGFPENLSGLSRRIAHPHIHFTTVATDPPTSAAPRTNHTAVAAKTGPAPTDGQPA